MLHIKYQISLINTKIICQMNWTHVVQMLICWSYFSGPQLLQMYRGESMCFFSNSHVLQFVANFLAPETHAYKIIVQSCIWFCHTFHLKELCLNRIWNEYCCQQDSFYTAHRFSLYCSKFISPLEFTDTATSLSTRKSSWKGSNVNTMLLLLNPTWTLSSSCFSFWLLKMIQR